MSAPLLPPLALWRRPILGNYFSTELALYASFRDYRRCRRLRRRQPRPDDGATRLLQQHPHSLEGLLEGARRGQRGGVSGSQWRSGRGDISGARLGSRVVFVAHSSLAFVKTVSFSFLRPPPPLARAQFVIRQLVRAKMKSLKKVACQSTKTSLARGSFGKGHWSLAVRSPLRGRFANLPISILDAAPRCRHRSHFVAAAVGPGVACACGGRGELRMIMVGWLAGWLCPNYKSERWRCGKKAGRFCREGERHEN